MINKKAAVRFLVIGMTGKIRIISKNKGRLYLNSAISKKKLKLLILKKRKRRNLKRKKIEILGEIFLIMKLVKLEPIKVSLNQKLSLEVPNH